MSTCKPISTPIVVQEHKAKTVADFADVSFYRMIVGSLQYQTITRPDISFVVNTVYMQKPNVDHLQMVKRIL